MQMVVGAYPITPAFADHLAHIDHECPQHGAFTHEMGSINDLCRPVLAPGSPVASRWARVEARVSNTAESRPGKAPGLHSISWRIHTRRLTATRKRAEAPSEAVEPYARHMLQVSFLPMQKRWSSRNVSDKPTNLSHRRWWSQKHRMHLKPLGISLHRFAPHQLTIALPPSPL